jgi:hypothetical protein
MLASVALVMSSCGEDSEGTGPAGAITISLASSSVTITQGGNGTVNVTLTRQNGFSEAVAVTVEGLPTGVTAAALSLPASQTSGTLTLTAASSAAVGTSALTVRATGPGVAAATASLSLTVQAAPTPAFTMSLSATSLSIAQGASGSSTITITRTGGFTGAVNLAATGLPAGVTAAFNPTPATGTSSTLTLTASATATTGSANVTVTGSGTGVTNQTATIALTVTAGAVGSISIALSPTTVTLPQGGSVTSTVTLTRLGGFNGPVSIAASGLPTGVTASFNPPSFTTGVTSTLTLNASSTAATGAATVTVTASAAAVQNATGTIGLTVTQSGGGGGNVSASFCPLVGTPLFVAFQDGTGSWVASTAVNGVYSGTVNSGRGGIAYVTARSGGGFQLNVRYGTTAELQAFNQVFCYGSTGTGKTVNATVAGAGLTEIAILTLGTAFSFATPGTPPPAFQNVPDGVLDLVGVRATIAGASYSPNRLFIQRGINPAAGSTVAVDFGGSNALDPITRTVTLGGLGSDQATTTIAYFTANRTFAPLSIDLASTSTSRSYGGFPAAAGSFHFINVLASPSGTTPDRSRFAAVIYGSVENRTVTLGPDLGSVTVTAAATAPALRLQAVVPTATYNTSWSATFTQGTGAASRVAAVQSTAGYVGTVPANVTLVVPDLSGVAGFQAAWNLVDASTTWSTQASAVTGFGAGGLFQDGATQLGATRTGTYAPEQQQNQER